MPSRRFPVLRALAVALLLVSALPTITTGADARAGGGFSLGSRGARTFSAPGFTRTAPMGAQPIQRSEAPSPGIIGAPGAAPRRFGFGSGLMAGLLGAGLFGLFGGGGFGGLVSLLLLGVLVVFALRLFRGRSAAVATGPMFRGAPTYAGGPAPGFPPRASGRPVPPAPVTLEARDFDAFEACLVDIETAYGREDLATLGRLVTPEMLRHFERDLRANHQRGVHNDVGDARLLQGDLAESWREGETEYATVAMRFSLRDLTVELASRRIVAGDPSRLQEAKELWTFRRDGRGPWLLSAIQQAR